ncbi:hypothetical protein EV356DRAFT_564020 [Viridothelium virens]|uniref:Uncharacterized protein n=1 Tax=Viridothelium virens TaxID=1048519 RepID=A0A6A6HLF1_VIRVR|nr:hypothetical protein EV356DRAFT_564020 [Viridothelium virens]
MAGLTAVLKTVFIPAVISLALYLSLTYAILPFIRRYRHKYNQYLPLNTISDRTSSFRQRLSDALMSFLLPSSWRRGRHRTVVDGSSPNQPEEELFDEEEGEGMVGFEIDQRRREALDQGRSGGGEEQRRLSRDLEEGFKDDSDEEQEARSSR